MQTQPTSVPLSQLSIDAANVRKTGRGAEAIYISSIEAKGVIEPLIVRPNGKGYTVVNGGKRLASLQAMLKAKQKAAGVPVDKNYPVPVVVRVEDTNEARDTSLITNTVRAGMHPVDRFEAFADLHKSGRSVADIGARYAMKPKEVQQTLALGALAPAVREAWREGTLEVDAARSFTLIPDLDEQARLFKRLKKSGRLHAHWVRQEVLKASGDAAPLVRFVGEEAYQAAGGKLVKDLFSSDIVVCDPALARKLADRKLAAKRDALKKAGWSWVELISAMPTGWSWSWSRIQKKISDFTAADRAKSGAVIQLSHNGQLDISYGILKPSAGRKKKAADKAERRKEDGLPENEISQALTLRLTESLTFATATALAKEPELALAVAIAALSTEYGAEEVKLRNEGLGAPPMPGAPNDVEEDEDDDGQSFAESFAAVVQLSLEQKLAAFATIVGSSLSFRRAAARPLVTEKDEDQDEASIIVNAIDAAAMNAALRERFNAADYFDSVSTALRVAAVNDAVNADEGAKVAKMKKADQVAFCLANVAKTGWLPVELRSAGYDGPGPGVAAPAAAAKTATKRKTVAS